MKLSELSQKPELLKITIDSEHIVEKYKEELEFWVYDRQPLDVFSRLANADSADTSHLIILLKDLILDEDGKPVIADDRVLPMDVMVEAVKLIGERLGK
jgi:hypothetical protein